MKKAICAIAKNEDKYIDEWAEYHFKLGIDDIFVFQNDWRYNGKLPEKYNGKGFHNMHLFECDGPVQQLNSYNFFIQQFGGRYDWVAFIDIDEFIAIDSSTTLDEQLSKFQEHMQVSLNWRLIGDNGLIYDGVDNSVVDRFKMGCKSLNQHVKQIVNLAGFRKHNAKYPKFVNPHFTNFQSIAVCGAKVNGPFNTVQLDQPQPIELYHYAVKTKQEFAEKIARGRADTPTGRDNPDEYFFAHNINEILCTRVYDFMHSA